MSESGPPRDGLSRSSEIIAGILTYLLQGGIQRRDVSALEIGNRIPPPSSGESNDELEDHFMDAMRWLEAEGYIRCDAPYGGSDSESIFPGAVLTAKCLGALDQPISALNGRSGREILDARREGDTSAANYVKAGAFLGGIFGATIKSAG